MTNQPTFINSASNDYYLSPGSPLIDRGMAIPGVNDNWLGAAPDIGALEYGMEATGISVNSNTVLMDWHAGVFGNYQLEFTTNLSQSGWKPLGSPTQAFSAFFRLTDSFTGTGERFYRLRHATP